MFAVVQTGGKQYRVQENDLLVVERLNGEVGSKVRLDDVLMVGNGDQVSIGQPAIDGAFVEAEVMIQRKGKKVIVFKKIRRHNYRRKKGHRQYETVLRITTIGNGH
ncbi:MAG: 50S ribosomal protein L21 [Alphaproteobacteria bacterium]|nr:50S ribosomal protein L21 [Alphaproteobacteria bacterium]